MFETLEIYFELGVIVEVVAFKVYVKGKLEGGS